MKARFDSGRLELRPQNVEQAEFLLALWVQMNGARHSRRETVEPQSIDASGSVVLRLETATTGGAA